MSLAERIAQLFSSLPEHPTVAANKEFFKDFDQTGPLSDYEFTVLDTELTGLDARRDHMVSVGAVRVRGLTIQPGETYFSLVKPDIPVPKVSTLIHHITPEDLENAPRPEKVLPELLEFMGGSLVVGHNVGLDLSVLMRACKAHLGGGVHTPCLDTMRLARVYEEELWESYYDQYNLNVSYNLGDLSRRYGLPVFDEHDALQDALQTAYLFVFLVKKLKGGGIETLKDLYQAGRSWRWYF